MHSDISNSISEQSHFPLIELKSIQFEIQNMSKLVFKDIVLKLKENILKSIFNSTGGTISFKVLIFSK